MVVNQRLKFFAEQSGLTAYRIAKDSGLNIPTVTKYLKDQSSIGSENLCAIAAAYPELNLDWLIRGRGEMLNRVEMSRLAA